MKTKYYLLAAFAGIALTSCTDDDLVGNVSPPVEEEVLAPIAFSSSQNAFTRADLTGADAAEKLNNMFVVTGFKGDATASPGSVVFDNYKVVYEENTANTTESNTNNWEYAGKDRIQHAIDNGITQQTVKYWDYTQKQYDFIAWGMGKLDDGTAITPIYNDDALSAHQVRVSAIKPNGKDGWGSDTDMPQISYTFEGKAEDLARCYVSDLVTVYKNAKTGTDDTYNVVYKGYQQPVTLKFRQLGTKVRIGLYETVPGYSVKNVKFYTKDGKLDASSAGTDETPGVVAAGQIVDNATIFSAGANIYTEGTYTVYFPTVDSPTNADNNQAHIKFEAKSGVAQATTVDFGAMNYTYRESGEKEDGAVYLGRSSNDATYAGNSADNYYVIYLPNETNGNLNLRVDFTLESIDGSKEEIKVKNAKAQVPSIYTTWKPGFAYTYLFKISDNTNGRTGVYDPTQDDGDAINSDPAGLYPITFDAMVVNAEDGDKTQETITTISTPSITTYQNGSKVVNNDEYTELTPNTEKKITGDIYVTVNDNTNTGALITLNTDAETANGVALYILSDGMTEAEVVDALTYQDVDASTTDYIMGRNGKMLTKATNVATADDVDADNEWALTNTVQYGVNGNAITVGDSQALRFNPAASTTYAFVYTKTAATTSTEIFQPVTKAKGESVKDLYRWQMGNAPDGDVKAGVKYFHSGKSDQLTVFLGQTVNNLFLDAAGSTKATGYAVTGTDYYYTDDNGMSYKKATNITYETFAATALYHDAAHTTAKTETEPADGQAYYDGDGKYCVILPQQTRPAGGQKLVIFDTSKPRILCADNEKASIGIEYFDKYTKNDGERYAKVIKVAP